VVFDHERVLAQYPLIGKIGRRSLTLATLTAVRDDRAVSLGRPSVYHYFDDDPGRRSITETMSGSETLQAAKALARAEQDKLG
jgi:hypothetical protein